MTEAGERRARRDKEQTHAGAPGTARREDRGGGGGDQPASCTRFKVEERIHCAIKMKGPILQPVSDLYICL